MGELHLQAVCDRLVHEYKVQIEIGKPEVIYVETIRKEAEAEGKYIRAISRHYMYGHVKLRLEPREAGSGYQFANESSEGAVPREFVEPVNLGIQEAMKGGILAGYEMIDLRAVLRDGTHMRSITHGRANYSMHFARYEPATHPGESGTDEAGVTANRPRLPKSGGGFATAKLDPESE